MGDFCLTYGLREDVARILSPPPSTVAEDTHPDVRAAAAALAEATAAENAAIARWEERALAGLQARTRRASGTQVVSVGGMLQSLRPTGTSDADIRRLADAEADADMIRRAAGDRVLVARQQLEAARARVRAKLAGTG